MVSTDLSKLRELIVVPPGVASARWLIRPLRPEGSRLVPGPMDTILIAYLETSAKFWAEQAASLPAVNGPSERIRAADARALLPAAVLASAPLSGDIYTLHCDAISPAAMNRSPQRAISAARCGTGILVTFSAQ